MWLYTFVKYCTCSKSTAAITCYFNGRSHKSQAMQKTKTNKKKKKQKSFLTSRISLAQLLCWPLVTCANTNKQTVTNEDKVTGSLNRQIIKGSFVTTQNNRHESGYKVDHIWAAKLKCSFHVVHTHFSCKHSRAHKLIHMFHQPLFKMWTHVSHHKGTC